MVRLPLALRAWGTTGFEDALKQEVAQLDTALLPLQQGLAGTSSVAELPLQVMILRVTDDARAIHVKTVIFYVGILSGCSCADDPTAVEPQHEQCEVLFMLDKTTAEATATLVSETDG